MDKVNLEKVKKQLKKIPLHIKVKLLARAKAVELEGVQKIRILKGYHDEPLKGERKGQRSIRLSKGYRAIYIEDQNGEINLIVVEEVHKHDY